jgi:hypothetical protein
MALTSSDAPGLGPAGIGVGRGLASGEGGQPGDLLGAGRGIHSPGRTTEASGTWTTISSGSGQTARPGMPACSIRSAAARITRTWRSRGPGRCPGQPQPRKPDGHPRPRRQHREHRHLRHRAHADEREAHIRKVERNSHSLSEGSYCRRNRQAIAARETRVATCLRTVERAYRTAIERDTMLTPPEPTRARHAPEHAADREIELE